MKEGAVEVWGAEGFTIGDAGLGVPAVGGGIRSALGGRGACEPSASPASNTAFVFPAFRDSSSAAVDEVGSVGVTGLVGVAWVKLGSVDWVLKESPDFTG